LRYKPGIYVLFFLLVILTFNINNVLAADPEVYCSTDKDVVAPGEEFTVDIMLKNVNDLYGASIDLKYDDTILEVVESSGKPVDDSAGLFSEEQGVFNELNGYSAQDSSLINYAICLIGSVPGLVVADDSMGKITFRVKDDVNVPNSVYFNVSNLTNDLAFGANVIVKLANAQEFDSTNPDYDKITYTGSDLSVDINSAQDPEVIIDSFNHTADANPYEIIGRVNNPVPSVDTVNVIVNGSNTNPVTINADGTFMANVQLDDGVNFVTLEYLYDGDKWSRWSTVIYWNTFGLHSIPTYDEEEEKYDGNIELDFYSGRINSSEQVVTGKLYKIDFQNKQVIDQQTNLSFTQNTDNNSYEALFTGPFNVGENYFIELYDSGGVVGNASIGIHPHFNITTDEWYQGTVETSSLDLSGYLAFFEGGYDNISVTVKDELQEIIDQKEITEIDAKGNFNVTVDLGMGRNNITIELTELEGGWTKSETKIYYQNFKVGYQPSYDYIATGDLELNFDSPGLTSPTLSAELYKLLEVGEEKVADLEFSLNDDFGEDFYFTETNDLTFREGESYRIKIFDNTGNLILFTTFEIHPRFRITSGNFAGTVYSNTENILGFLAFVDDGYQSLTYTLNNGDAQNVNVNSDNTFSFTLNLDEGTNTISLKLLDSYDGTTTGGSQIYYDPPTLGFTPPQIVTLDQQPYGAWHDGVLTDVELNAAGTQDIPLKVILPQNIGVGSGEGNQQVGYWIAVTFKDSIGNIDFKTWAPISQSDLDQGYIDKNISVGYLQSRKLGESYKLSAGLFSDGNYQGGFEQTPVIFSYATGTVPVTPAISNIDIHPDGITVTFSEEIIAADGQTVTFASGTYNFDIFTDEQSPSRLGHYGLLEQNSHAIKIAVLGDFNKSADYVFKLYTGDFNTPTVIAESDSFTFTTVSSAVPTALDIFDTSGEEIWVTVEDTDTESLLTGLTIDDFILFDAVGDQVDFDFAVGPEVDQSLPEHEYLLYPQASLFEGYYWLRFAKEGHLPISQMIQIIPTQDILAISFTPDTYQVGFEHTIDVTVYTSGIDDGSEVSVSLVGPSVDNIVVDPVTATINNNTATLQIVVPDTVTAGSYSFKAEVGALTSYNTVTFTDQVVTPTVTAAGTLTNNVASDASHGQTIDFLLTYTLGEDFDNGDVVFTLPMDYAFAPYDGGAREPFHDQVNIAGNGAVDLSESQVDYNEGEGPCVVTVGNITASAGQTVVLEMNGEYLFTPGTFNVSAAGDADGSGTAKTPSAGIGSEVTNFTIIHFEGATLNEIDLSEGALDPAFNPNIFTYNVALPSGTMTIPIVDAGPIDPDDEVEITQADSIPGAATIVVTSAATQNSNTYTINFSEVVSPKITIGSKKGVNGSTAIVPITIENGNNITGVQFDLLYDASIVQALELVEDELANLSGSYNIDNTIGKITFLYYSDSATPIASNATLGNMSFDIIGSAGEITTLDLDNLQIGNSNGALQFIDVDGSIEVIAVRYGDVNNDGNINVFDILGIVDHILNRQTLTGTSLIAANVTGDSSLNVFDILEIVDHILKGDSFTVEE